MSTPVQISILDLADGIIVEENGYYFDQKDVLTLGYWAWEKMADFLPYDYHPDSDTIDEMRAKMNTEPEKENPVEENVPEENNW